MYTQFSWIHSIRRRDVLPLVRLFLFSLLIFLPLSPLSSAHAGDPDEEEELTFYREDKFLNRATSELDQAPKAPTKTPNYQSQQSAGSTISGALQAAFNQGIRFLRTVLLFFLLIYTLFVGVGMAFGQAGMNDVLSLILGIIFFAGAGAVATIYHVLFF